MQYSNLYIHVPFCLKKCDYCVFFSVERSTSQIQRQWLDRIRRHLETHADQLKNVHTVYFGGGTPTLLTADLLESAFRSVCEIVKPEPGAEFTTEANPETVTDEKADVIARFTNRVSMGIQSFDPVKRAILGRHPESPEHVVPAAERLRKYGVKNLGFDLMYAAPGETMDGWKRDLNLALELKPQHLSCYSLTPEEHTPYAKLHGLAPVNEDLSAEMWLAAGEILSAHGLPRYEISNYAAPGFEARHNCNVWFGETYLGLGPSACSFDGTDRFTEPADLSAWLRGEPPEYDRIPRAQRVREILMMGLRTVCGWNKNQFADAIGDEKSWDAVSGELESLQKDGLIQVSGDVCRATEKGLQFWNDIAERLLL